MYDRRPLPLVGRTTSIRLESIRASESAIPLEMNLHRCTVQYLVVVPDFDVDDLAQRLLMLRLVMPSLLVDMAEIIQDISTIRADRETVGEGLFHRRSR